MNLPDQKIRLKELVIELGVATMLIGAFKTLCLSISVTILLDFS